MNPQMDNKFLSKTTRHLNELCDRSRYAENHEVSGIAMPIHELFKLLIKQTNKINELEKDVKRLKKLNQLPYRQSAIILRMKNNAR